MNAKQVLIRLGIEIGIVVGVAIAHYVIKRLEPVRETLEVNFVPTT